MRYEVHGKFLMGDLTFYVEAENEEAARVAATTTAFADVMKLAKKITVVPVSPSPGEEKP